MSETSKLLERCLPMEDLFAIFPQANHYISITHEGRGVVVAVQDTNRDLVAQFGASAISGNASVVVLHAQWLPDHLRHQGIGTKLQALKTKWMRSYQASMLMCTVVDGNAAQEKILAKAGWTKVKSVRNRKTGNQYSLYYKVVADE